MEKARRKYLALLSVNIKNETKVLESSIYSPSVHGLGIYLLGLLLLL